MFFVLWRFHAAPGREEGFESAYGARGLWADLFARSPGYRGTELLRSVEGAREFVTIDRWENRDAWLNFLREHPAEYAALDQECGPLTAGEVLIGEYEA
jgi:heme-degrading monooxygenase HmoA